MGKFSTYGAKINEIAKNAFNEYKTAAEAYETAKSNKTLYPVKYGVTVEDDYLVKSTTAERDYTLAKNTFDSVKNTIPDRTKAALAELRREYENAVRSEYAASPSKVDAATIELLKSGILTADEYRRLINDAEASDNDTMARIIRQYAATAAETTKNDTEARVLRALVMEKSASKIVKHLENFDYCVTVFNKCVKNPGIMDHWGEFVESKLDVMF